MTKKKKTNCQTSIKNGQHNGEKLTNTRKKWVENREKLIGKMAKKWERKLLKNEKNGQRMLGNWQENGEKIETSWGKSDQKMAKKCQRKFQEKKPEKHILLFSYSLAKNYSTN